MGTLIGTHMTGVATLDFSDGYAYNVANGTFGQIAATSGTGTGTGSTGGTTSGSTGGTTSGGTGGTTPGGTSSGTAVIFAAGNDTLAIPSGTTSVTGNGDANDTALLQGDHGWFNITKNSDGSITVSDWHMGTLIGTHMTGVATLDFSDGYAYNVANGTFGQIAATSGTGTGSTGGTTSGSTGGTTSGGTGGTTSGSTGGTTSGSSTGIVNGTTVAFAPGADVLTPPNGVTSITGNGDPNDVLVLQGDHNWYNISRNTNDSFTVTDWHLGDLHNTTVTGVHAINFADGYSYDFATGTFSPTAAATTGASVATTTVPATAVVAPTLPQAQNPGDIVDARIENTTSQAAAAHDVSFGQVFADGDMPAGGQLIATINGQQVPVQMDVKTTYADGSVAMAVVTVDTPALAAGASTDIMLGRGTPATTAPALSPNDFVSHGYNAQLTLNFHNADGTQTPQTIDIGNALTQALAQGTAQTWLNGPLSSEVLVTVPINNTMHAVFAISGNADGTFSTDVQVYNSAGMQAAQTYSYDATITENGKTVYSQPNIQQYSLSSWHQTVYSNADPTYSDFVVHDVNYLQKTGAIASFDTSLGVTSAQLSSDAAKLAASNTGPMGPANVTQGMEMAGGRPDIGPTTQWSADYLASQSPVAYQVMIGEANASGSVPWNITDNNGQLLTITSNPNLWLDGRATSSQSLATNYSTTESASGWALDTAHMPDLSYIPYLMTGNPYYLSQLQDQANYDVASLDPGYRSGSEGLVSGTVRQIAWTLRDLTEAAFATPNADPLKGYFTNLANNNINHLVQQYITSGNGASEGQLQGYIFNSYDSTTNATWQQDFLAMAMAHASQLGFTNAGTFAAWENNFIAGLFLNGSNGYNPLEGTAYYLQMMNPSLAPSQAPVGQAAVATTWAQVYALTYGAGYTPTQLDGSPDMAGGYAAGAKGALASLYNATHSVDDLAAYAYVVQQTPNMQGGPNGYSTNQTYDITPVLPDGHQLLNTEIVNVIPDSSVTAPTPDSMLVAVSGHNVLQGGNGIAILMGGSGTDTLIGGTGNDFLFAGTGTERLSAGAGNNYLRGNAGADTFVFNPTDTAHDEVVGFKPGTDTIEIDGSAGLTAAGLISSATADANGNAVLHLSSQHSVVLDGIHLNQIAANWFHMT